MITYEFTFLIRGRMTGEKKTVTRLLQVEGQEPSAAYNNVVLFRATEDARKAVGSANRGFSVERMVSYKVYSASGHDTIAAKIRADLRPPSVTGY